MELCCGVPTSDDYYVTALQIFDYCGTESTGTLRVDSLMEKFAPFVKTKKSEYSFLKTLLDPDHSNPEINVIKLAKALNQYSENQKSKIDFEESFNISKEDQMPQDSDSGISSDGFLLLEELQCELREKAHLAHKLRNQLEYTDSQHEEALAAITTERDSLRAYVKILRDEISALAHVRPDYEEACDRLCASDAALDEARRELDGFRRRDKILQDRVSCLESDKLTLQELLSQSKEECHRINEMYASRQSMLLEQNESLKSSLAEVTAKHQDQEEILHQLINEKVLLEMELKDVLNKSNQYHINSLNRSIDVSYTEEQMLTALDSLNNDTRFMQDNQILDEEAFVNALKEDQGRTTNLSLYDEIRYSTGNNMSELNLTDVNSCERCREMLDTSFTTTGTQTDDGFEENQSCVNDDKVDSRLKCLECEKFKILTEKLMKNLDIKVKLSNMDNEQKLFTVSNENCILSKQDMVQSCKISDYTFYNDKEINLNNIGTQTCKDLNENRLCLKTNKIENCLECEKLKIQINRLKFEAKSDFLLNLSNFDSDDQLFDIDTKKIDCSTEIVELAKLSITLGTQTDESWNYNQPCINMYKVENYLECVKLKVQNNKLILKAKSDFLQNSTEFDNNQLFDMDTKKIDCSLGIVEQFAKLSINSGTQTDECWNDNQPYSNVDRVENCLDCIKLKVQNDKLKFKFERNHQYSIDIENKLIEGSSVRFEPIAKLLITSETQTEECFNNVPYNNVDKVENCLQCEKLIKYTNKLQCDVTQTNSLLSDMKMNLENYDTNSNRLQLLLDDGNRKNARLNRELLTLQKVCDAHKDILDSLSCDKLKTDCDQITTATQVNMSCVECVKRTAVVPPRGVRKYLWRGLMALFQMFAIVCFVCAISALYNVTKRFGARCERGAVPWRWLDVHELMDMLFRIEYIADVPM